MPVTTVGVLPLVLIVASEVAKFGVTDLALDGAASSTGQDYELVVSVVEQPEDDAHECSEERRNESPSRIIDESPSKRKGDCAEDGEVAGRQSCRQVKKNRN